MCKFETAVLRVLLQSVAFPCLEVGTQRRSEISHFPFPTFCTTAALQPRNTHTKSRFLVMHASTVFAVKTGVESQHNLHPVKESLTELKPGC